MTTALAIRSILELAAILLLLYGIYKEEKLIAFEQKVWRILFVNYRRYKRKKYGMPLKKAKAEEEKNFKLYDNTAPKGHGGETGFVA